MRKHKVNLADWMKKLMDCESAKSLEVECRVKFKADCDRMQNQLKSVMEQLKALRTRAEEAEAAFRQLKEETTNSLRLRVKRCLRSFIIWKVQTLKWLKLDFLEQRLMSMKINMAARHN